jgi:hypothetical protein
MIMINIQGCNVGKSDSSLHPIRAKKHLIQNDNLTFNGQKTLNPFNHSKRQ